MKSNANLTTNGNESPREYIKVVPSSESLNTDSVVGFASSLRKAKCSARLARFNPLADPPTFEFLITSRGKDSPIEFLFGCTDSRNLDLLERKLRSAYPSSFDVSRTTFSMNHALKHPAYPETLDVIPDRTSSEIAAGELTSSVASQSTIEQYENVDERPPTPKYVPVVVRWDGEGEKSKDYMTTIKRYSSLRSDGETSSRSPLSYILEVVSKAEFPIVYQVLLQRRPSWTDAASHRKNQIRIGEDGLLDAVIRWFYELIFPPSKEELQDRYRGQTPTEPGDSGGVGGGPAGDIAGRMQLIDEKIPTRTYTVNVRAGAFAPIDDEEVVRETMESLTNAFELDGSFYSLEGAVISGFIRNGLHRLSKGKIRTASQLEFARMHNREIVSTNHGKRRPHLVLNHDELANFLTVPSRKSLTDSGARGTEGKQPSQHPLPRPPEGDLRPFREPGMEIGYALDENGDPESEPLNIPSHLQPKHTLVAAPTGGGKSIFSINAAKSIFRNDGGPLVIIDPKGDGMCSDYMRVHLDTFGNLDDVYYFQVPETLPAIPFFDIRPRIANPGNRDPKNVREEAVQDKVDHTHEILRMVMGQKVYDRALANTITSNLIHALYDEEYGNDAFGLDDLYEAAIEMQAERTIPPIAPGRPNDPEGSLSRHFSKDKRQFQQSMDAVLNRLEGIKEDSFLSQIFSHVPDWDDVRGEYTGNVFDFRKFLDRDAVILFDLGHLRPESQRVFTIVFLSHLWDAVQERKRDQGTNYNKVTNLIIDEAAPITASSLVSDQLLPQARSFGLSMTLLVQFARQIRNETGDEKAYEEVLNNVPYKIAGGISIDQTLLNTFVHDDLSPEALRNRINRLPMGELVVQLPSPGFGEPKPPLFSLKPLPIPDGHPVSRNPLSQNEERRFQSELLPSVTERTASECGIQSESSGPSRTTWGSHAEESESRSEDLSDYYSSIFTDIDQTDDGEQADESDGGQADSNGVNSSDEGNQEDLGTETSTDEEGPTPTPSPPDDPSNPDSNPIPSAGAGVKDDELAEHGLTKDDIRFLKRVLDAMNGDLPEFSLLDGMSELGDGLDNLDVSRLVEGDFLEVDRVSRRRYYTVLPAGRRLLGETISAGPGTGDIGEKTAHKVGVELLARRGEQQEGIARVERYYEDDPDTVFDVVAFDESDDIAWVGEVELVSNDREAPVRDFDKMAQIDANAVWVFRNRRDALLIIDILAGIGKIRPVTGRNRKSIELIRNRIESQQVPGMTTISTFQEIDSELE